MMSTDLWRVEGKRFVAGIKVSPDGTIVDAAPILGQWRRENFPEFRELAARQGWRVEKLPNVAPNEP
jgi:hypothetical protein